MDIKALQELVAKLEQRVAALEEEVGVLAGQMDEIDDALAEFADDIYGEDDEDDVFDVECPGCGELIQIDIGILQEGFVNCPGCEETLEFEFGCDCEDCGGCGDDEKE